MNSPETELKSGFEIPPEEKLKSVKPSLSDIFEKKHLVSIAYFGLSSGFSVLIPWCLVKVVDDGITLQSARNLIFWLVAAALLQALSGVLRYLGTCRTAHFGLEREKKRLNSLFSTALRADVRALPERGQGQMMGQILFAASSERHFIETLYSQGTALLVTGIGTVTALGVLSWKLTLLSILLCPAAAYLWHRMKRKIRPATNAEYTAHELLYARIVDTFRALTSIRAFHQTEKFETRFVDSSSECMKTGYELTRQTAFQGPYIDILQAIVLVIIFGIGGYGVMHQMITIGALLGFQIYLSRLFVLFRSGTGLFGSWQQYIEGRARSSDIEKLPPSAVVDYKESIYPEILRLDDVSFSFGEHEVLSHHNLVIKEGEYHSILLPSGGGKTTLARCILGIYPVQSGAISLPQGRVEHVGFVPQENVLFNGSIKDNILLFTDNNDTVLYDELLYMTCLETLATTYGSKSIGEHGECLSGGEQRRVMLGRALACNPKLLIIDQMSSELEPELCRTIFHRIRERRPALSILYLGHRQPEWD
ncbi:MAG: ABC transporter ATP-binding protein [Proteobacteria bacterium]|nr:ABC transporter ATP-binding protein [Pseudomonadota bacterium]